MPQRLERAQHQVSLREVSWVDSPKLFWMLRRSTERMLEPRVHDDAQRVLVHMARHLITPLGEDRARAEEKCRTCMDAPPSTAELDEQVERGVVLRHAGDAGVDSPVSRGADRVAQCKHKYAFTSAASAAVLSPEQHRWTQRPHTSHPTQHPSKS